MRDLLLDDNSLEEEISLQRIEYPSRSKRLFAAVVDIILVNIGFVFFGALLGVSSLFTSIIAAFAMPIYKITAEGNYGQTLGKKIFNIRVVLNDGRRTPITPNIANRRFLYNWPINIVAFFQLYVMRFTSNGTVAVAIIVFMFGAMLLSMAGVMSIFNNNENRTWYDKLANTVCIKDN